MLTALQFLTILPIRGARGEVGASAAWFPLVGCLLGLAAAVVLKLPQGAVFALLLVTVLTGGLHEDGLADVCDAVRVYRSREKMMEILHDSRIGTHGALAIVFSLLIRWQALEHLTGDTWMRLPAALGISRGLVVMLAACTAAAGSGLGREFRNSLSELAVWMTGFQVLALCFAGGWRAALYLIPLQVVILVAVRFWFMLRLGGVTGDALGFACQVSEAATLVVFTWA